MIAAVTMTGGRPFAIEQCCRYVDRQTTKHLSEWVVVDDVEPCTTDQLAAPRVGKFKQVIPPWKWEPGQNTLTRSLDVALRMLEPTAEWVAVMEDDDWYAPDYLEHMIRRGLFSGKRLVGCMNTIYYHLPSRTWARMGNRQHSSLCQTVWHHSLTPAIREILAAGDGSPFVDIPIWKRLGMEHGLLLEQDERVVGIKGLSGRPGTGVGHRRPLSNGDNAGRELKRLMGDRDSRTYLDADRGDIAWTQ